MDAGKTTVGSALVRILEEKSGASFAIKPRSNYRWHAYADDWVDWNYRADLMSCSDTMQLNAHSTLFSHHDVELAAPCQFISSSGWKYCLFLRCGSKKTNNRQLFLSNQSATELSRNSFGEDCYPFDVENFNKTLKLDFGWNSSHTRTSPYIESSVSQILDRKPQNLVFEGAGPKVPTWRKDHLMKNIVVVSNFTVHVFQNVNLVVRNASDRLTNLKDLTPLFRSACRKSGRMRFVEPDSRNEEAYSTLKKLLDL